jgi:hypothetical protein
MRLRCLISLAGVMMFGAGLAHADLWQNVWRGLEVLSTPLGGPLNSLADGTRTNGARAGRLRIVPSGIGDGYEIQFDRTFGVDSRGRSETLQLAGLAEITLDGATQATLGYNGSGAFRTYRADFFANNLTYSLRSKNGIQDVQLVGILSASNAFEINPLGFYTLNVSIRNTSSQLFVDGLAVRDQESTNFDIGPISIRGNLYYDVALAIMTAVGADTTELEKVFPRSPIDEIDAAIRDALQQAGLVAGATTELELAPLLGDTVADQTAADLFNSLVAQTASNSDCTGCSALAATLPEPGTLLLFAGGAALTWRWRRR